MRFLLSGYYGFDNLGDDALLQIIVSQLKRRYPLATVEVLSAKPDETAYALGVEATPRWDQGAIRAAVARADVVLSGGGGLLQNATSLKSLFYYASIIRSGIRAEKPTMVFAQSVGPLDFFGKKMVRELCKGLAAATVRDERSRELFAPLVPATSVELAADPVLLYEPPQEPIDLGAHGLGAASDPLAVVCVRKTAHFSDGIATLASAVDRLAHHGARVAFVPFGGVADAEASTAVIRKCRSQPMLVALEGLDAVAAAIARAKIVIGVRLHALVLALRFGVPFLFVPYDPKISGLVADVHYPLPALWAPGTRALPGRVDELVDEAWTRRAELGAHLNAEIGRQRELAERSFTVLARLVNG